MKTPFPSILWSSRDQVLANRMWRAPCMFVILPSGRKGCIHFFYHPVSFLPHYPFTFERRGSSGTTWTRRRPGNAIERPEQDSRSCGPNTIALLFHPQEPCCVFIFSFPPWVRSKPLSHWSHYLGSLWLINYLELTQSPPTVSVRWTSPNKEGTFLTWGNGSADDSNTFSGFKSQWTIFLKWRCLKSHRIWGRRWHQ